MNPCCGLELGLLMLRICLRTVWGIGGDAPERSRLQFTHGGFKSWLLPRISLRRHAIAGHRPRLLVFVVLPCFDRSDATKTYVHRLRSLHSVLYYYLHFAFVLHVLFSSCPLQLPACLESTCSLWSRVLFVMSLVLMIFHDLF